MILRQTLRQAVQGYWNGGKKQTFDWSINKCEITTHNKKLFVRIGSWYANHWFRVALGKTDKLTLSYAKKHLQSATRIISKFKYVEDN